MDEVQIRPVHPGDAGDVVVIFNHGFEVVGRFDRIGRKWDEEFGVVWVRREVT